MTEKEWIEKVLPAARAASQCYGYLLSVMLGQVCQETGYGTRPLVKYYNIIGMKAKLLPYVSEYWKGRVIVTGTWEEIDGAHVDKDDAFRWYDSFEACLMDYCQFMRDGQLGPGRYKYRDVLSIKNPETLIRTVNARGYATDSNYAPAVLDIIKEHNLTQYDKEKTMHYISNCGHDENGRYSGGQAGDQTGTEWEIREWYSRPWDVILEPPYKVAADTIAEMAIESAHNEYIGYDQGERTSFDAQLQKVTWPKEIRTKCEADCSAGVAAIVRATGRLLGDAKMAAVSKDAYTGNLEKALVAAGFIAHRGNKWTDSPDYIGNGWILLYTGHHTAISVSKGAKWEEAKKVIVTRSKWINGMIKTAETAQKNGWRYGDSHTTPPCLDGVISCDRGPALTLARDFGIEQKPGGWNSAELAANVEKYGFTKTTDRKKIKAGAIVMIGKGPDKTYHTMVVERYDPATDMCDKIDFGSDERIRAGARFKNVKLVEWPDRFFSMAFNPADDPAPAKTAADYVREGQVALNTYFGAGLKTDASRGRLTETAFVKAFQTCLNLDYYKDGPMPVNGKLTNLTRAGLGTHYVEYGEKPQYLTTISEIGKLLAGKNPGGVEFPGNYGTNLQACVGKKRMTAEDIWALFRPDLLK